ncbi:unnamed protein product [Penicillium nalgiovense]|uniref:Uncharacterized protein n=1 Tax=Penicillium nalgiovense TaxID=60175 RepID=A0A9W4MUT2_PENNA|nr:unnamed protein product [Penicillium nalgiovense]CAG7962004.1 unnamed protein product [Penicillium nalgiovense]CAG7987418.1 unnamed protein product [Penicillium nalgiovense]CAG8004163.1 unnamed protein product [Penicillium nalgiovense]CAG8006837.1 unnamed protein product [Penicillium nalgiovense]
MATLAGLPLLISDHLPLVDLICFSICNRRLLELSMRQISRLHSTPDDKFSILIRLERDLPEYFACDICNILHQYDGSETFGLSGVADERTCQLPCVRTGGWFGSSFTMRTHWFPYYSASHLSFLQLKLAMRRFYYGPRYDIISLFSKEAQICPKPLGLCIRIQDIVLVKTRDYLTFPIITWLGPLPNLEQCAHYHLLTLIRPVMGSLHGGGTASFAHTCHKCNTDSQIELVGFDSKIAVIMTRWLNLGPGLTKDDLFWKSHVWLGRPDRDGSKRSPRLWFEDMASQSFEDLRSLNLSYLRNEQYKKVMSVIAGRNVWYISYKKPSKKR